jgi:drug/metabolite transporter (DMT)-like permease
MNDPLPAKPRPPAHRQETIAVLALLLATVFWGSGFAWAKQAGQAVQDRAGLGRQAPFGPIFILAWRFGLAAAVWFAVFPAARRGWTLAGVRRSSIVGLLLGAGLIVQHLGLDRTSEAVSAFLTSLTILFVPILMLAVFRKPPRPILWLGVVLATIGVWIMTGAQPEGFGWGEVLGLSCAFVFSLYILSVNSASAHETPWRLVGAQFAVVAAMCFACCLVLRGSKMLRIPMLTHILAAREVWQNVLLLMVFTTLLAFGLLTFFQPRIDPTRAALVYLAEPIFATIYAALFAGHRAGGQTLVGAALILLANVLVEIVSSRVRGSAEEKVVLVD